MTQSGLGEDHGVTVASVNRAGMTMANPRGDLVLQAEDLLFVIATWECEPVLR